MKKFKALFKPEPEERYTASVPSLPGCISYGKTLEEAKKMLADAISCYLKRMKEHGECSPDDSECIVDEISIADE